MLSKHELKKKLKYLKFIPEYILLKVALFFLVLVPRRAAIAVAEGACYFAARTIKRKRFATNINSIMRALPGTSYEEAFKIAKTSWKNMGRIMMEFIYFTRMTPEKMLQSVDMVGFDKMKEFYKNGQGCIAHTGHFTNWEAFGLAASALGVDKAVMAQKTENPFVDKEVKRLRCKFGGKIITTDEPFFTCVRWLKQGKVLGILTDQNSYKSAIFTKFLGRYCATSPITALLSIKLKVPVIPVKITRVNGRIRIEALDPVWPPEGKYCDKLVLDYTNTLNKYYEDWIKEDPSSWLWAHNRWKRGKEALKALGITDEKK